MGYIVHKLWDLLWVIFVKSYGLYLTKTRGHIGKTMGYIMGYNWQYFKKIGYSR